jgi:hypothetical protein
MTNIYIFRLIKSPAVSTGVVWIRRVIIKEDKIIKKVKRKQFY